MSQDLKSKPRFRSLKKDSPGKKLNEQRKKVFPSCSSSSSPPPVLGILYLVSCCCGRGGKILAAEHNVEN
jgi:hypothetical protein